ncbi:MAG: bifunctional (p)ppGpp synthetase/guanosine-3',5'-bis(diphosphate) 3'-pyrophosphohydrolase [Magnetococcales bacterium]|nr:bifunctional (p)ppGpp synthetase/guanosine-3',5'-bis(diphosphate) 3'-pyrophosphohydrolase [Magnetococcales bacterium]MBF0584484.1 bifunctional (p)ppGpp synthetase/guanosine-3',5'-bis(diphosphate) 3'-pyrophosphohydrolase [Magnetococcales bacterium]
MSRASDSKTEAQWWAELVERIRSYHPGVDNAFLGRLYHQVEKISRPVDFLAGKGSAAAGEGKGAVPADLPAATGEATPPPALGWVPFRPPEIATILVDLRLDMASIAAGLLLEGVASHRLTLADIRQDFGEDVAFLVEGVTKIAMLSARAKAEPQAEELRKMILSMAQDIRVVLVRLAFCLQQLRTMAAAQKTEQALAAPHLIVPPPSRLTREILEIYSPIAHRLGIYWIKNELEDLAFQLSQPEVYAALCEQVAAYRQGGADEVRKMVTVLTRLLRKHNISGHVLGREKHIYSIYSKLQRKGGSLDALYDMVGYRILVRKKSDCYRVLGMIHGEFRPIPGRLKDYIALPKSNGYQSLHSVVLGPFGNRLEIQIRTEKMHQVAESGVAAHWSYKEGLHTKKHSGATGFDWLKRMLEQHQNADDPKQFLDNVKIDLFPNEIYLFSPRGDIITLPVGATPVDFAYAVHSEVGDHCQGAKVNGRMVPLRTTLSTGDVVEIITSRNQHPNLDWLRFVVTGQARYRINRWEKKRCWEQSIALGRELLGREIQKAGHGMSLTEKLMQQAAELFKLASVDELLVRLGSSVLSPTQVVGRLFPDWERGSPASKPRSVPVLPKPGSKVAGKADELVPPALHLEGLLSEMAVVAARCCSPVPGDQIVGIVTTGKGITLHAQICPNLDSLRDQPDRWIETVDWPEEARHTYLARLRVWASNRRETTTRISHAVSGAKAGIIKIQVQDRDRDPCQFLLDVDVTGLNALERVMQGLRGMAEVVGVERILG